MAASLIGRVVAERYRLIAPLGEGGMATVFLGRHLLIGRLSAIKLLRPELAASDTHRDRFLREARAANRVHHPNIVEILDYGETDGLVYLVMEYVPGEPLHRLLERGPLGWRRAAYIGMQIASALGRAHQMDVIHRDLKPANILDIVQRGERDVVKLTDFGVAKMHGAPTITTSAVALGTPGYVAPEYAALGTCDGRSDLFSLGVVIYEATCGRLPFGPGDNEAPPELSSRMPDVPEFFDDILAGLLARDPDDRPRDGFEVADRLRRALEREADRGGRPSATSIVPFEEADTPLDATTADESRRAAPHLATVAFDRIAPLCSAALSRLEGEHACSEADSSAAEAALVHARKLVAMVNDIARLVAADASELDAMRARAGEAREEMGQELDALARERSKALGWAGLLGDRSDVVRMRRHSGVDPIPVMEAMVWEEAALEQQEVEARDRATELEESIAQLRAEIGLEDERLEHEAMVATARLEGRVAALRCIALEAWTALESAADRVGLPVSVLT